VIKLLFPHPRLRYVVLGATFLFLLGISIYFQRAKEASRMPDFSLPIIINPPLPFITHLNLSDTQGSLSVLFFFGLDDCPTCLFEIEQWASARRESTTALFNLIGITYTTDVFQITEFCHEYGIDFPICLDANKVVFKKIQKELGKEYSYIPFKVILDRNARIIDTEMSEKETTIKEIKMKLVNYYKKGLDSK